MTSNSEEMQARLPGDIEESLIREVLKIVEDRIIDKSEQHQDELRVVDRKLKMKTFQTIAE